MGWAVRAWFPHGFPRGPGWMRRCEVGSACPGGDGVLRAALSSQPGRAAGSFSIPVFPFPRSSSATRRGRARAGGSQWWRWRGSHSTKPRRKGCSSSSSTSEEPTTRVRGAACPAGLGGCLWLTAAGGGLAKAGWMDGGNSTMGPPGLWVPAPGLRDGDGPVLGKINLPHVRACPAKSCYESTPNPSLFQGKISKIMCLMGYLAGMGYLAAGIT